MKNDEGNEAKHQNCLKTSNLVTGLVVRKQKIKKNPSEKQIQKKKYVYLREEN